MGPEGELIPLPVLQIDEVAVVLNILLRVCDRDRSTRMHSATMVMIPEGQHRPVGGFLLR